MSILRRKMFRGGGYAHRGTGITSGLDTPKRGYVDGPGSYAGPEDAQSSLPKFKARDFPTIFEEKQGILQSLRPPTQEFNKLDAAAPALMTFFGNLMSGKSFESGFGGAFDIAGNAITQATPQFSEALAARRAAEAADRKEKFALDLQAYESAEAAHAAELAREAKAMEIKYKKDEFTFTDKNGRLMVEDRESIDDGFSWTPIKGSLRPKVADTFVKDSSGMYTVDDEDFLGYAQIIDGNKQVIKRMDNDEIVNGATKKTVYELGANVYSVLNTDDQSFTGLQIDLATDEGLEIYEKILDQKEGDTVLINNKEIPVKDLSITKDDPKFDKKPEFGAGLYTEFNRDGQATGVQIDIAAPDGYGPNGEMSGLEYYKQQLLNPDVTLAKVGINAADADSLASNMPPGYNKDLRVTQDAAVLFVQDLLPAYVQSQQENFIPQGTIVGEGFRWINNIKSNIDNFAKLYMQDPENNQPVFVDEFGEGIDYANSDAFLEAFMGKSEANRSLVESVAVGGELFNSQIIGLAYSLAKSNNPDGRISEPDFRYALQELKGRTADPSIMGDIMLLQYGKAKNKFIQAWINQANENGIPRILESPDGKGGTIQKTWIDQAEDEWFARSLEANKFEQILGKKDKENGTNKKELVVTESKKYSIPPSWDGKLLIENGKPAKIFIKQWLNSPSPVEGLTMGEFVTTNGFILSYINADGEPKMLQISVKK